MSASVLYHGSTQSGIAVLEPRKRFVPGSMGAEAPEAIYAGKTAAYAAAHSWPWSSDGGVDIRIEDGREVLIVPAAIEDRLQQKVFVYVVPADAFQLMDTEPHGYNFWSQQTVMPLSCLEYASVREALEKNGGSVRLT